MSDFQYEIDDGEATITGYTGAGGDVVVPDEIGGLPVTTIGISVFGGCSSLTSITLPNSLTTLGAGAFRDCTGLTSISLSNDITRIGNYAFADCPATVTIRPGEIREEEDE